MVNGKFLVFLFVLLGTNLYAQSDSVTKPFTFTGYVDTYYFYNFNKVTTNLGVSGVERAFDQRANSFEVGMAQIKTTYSKNKTEAVIDLTFGNHADLGNYGNLFTPINGKNTSTALAIKQAYLTYKVTDKWSFTAGQFVTHIGYEVVDAPINYNYSLSNLFTNGPFYHTGLKTSYSFTDKVSVMAGIVDGLDSKDDNNKGKGFISQIILKPKENLGIYLNYFGSNESVTDTSLVYNIFDAVINYQVNSKFYLGLNAAYGFEEKEQWGGVALYSNYAFSPKISSGIRYEYFNNMDAARLLVNANGTGTYTNSFTLTSVLKLGDNIDLKPELRYDSFKKGSNQFADSQSKPKDTQTTLGVAAIFHF